MYNVSWFLEDKLVAQGSCPPEIRFGAPRAPQSLLYMCPTCGDVWARIAVEGCKWYPIARRCKKHGPPFLLRYGDHPLNASANLAIYAREFLIAYEAYTKLGHVYDIYLIAGAVS
jgi:hypothetical protein